MSKDPLLKEIEEFTGLLRLRSTWINVDEPKEDPHEARRLLAIAWERLEQQAVDNPAGADKGESSGEHIRKPKPLYKILEERGYQYRPPLPNDD